MSVDFPLPVRPTTPIFSPAFIFKERSCKTGDCIPSYVNPRFLISISNFAPLSVCLSSTVSFFIEKSSVIRLKEAPTLCKLSNSYLNAINGLLSNPT